MRPVARPDHRRLTRSEGLRILLGLVEELVIDPVKKSEIKTQIEAAYEERGEVIAKYALVELSRTPTVPLTAMQSDQISAVSYNFV